MPYFISGVTADHTDLIARTPAEFKSLNDIDVLTRHRVLEVDTANRKIKVADLVSGREFYDHYTRLLISTGAHAFLPELPGSSLEGVFTLRKLADSISIRQFVRSRRVASAVIVGAGPIGIEMCESFRSLGIEVSLVESAEQVMPFMAADLAALVQDRLEREGVACYLGQAVEGIEGGPGGAVRAVRTASSTIDAEVVLLGLGVRPSSELASAAGIELGVKGAIRVDRRMATSAPGVFAAVDCATAINTISGLETWMPLGSTARKQGRLAGETMFGADTGFPGIQGTSVVKCFDITVGRTGLDSSESSAAGFQPAVVDIAAPSLHDYYPGGGTIHLKVIADGPSGRILGAQTVGAMHSVAEKRLDVLAVAVHAGLTAEDLQYLDLAYAPPYSTAVDAVGIAGNLMAGKILAPGCSCDAFGLD
jgi:NADPH-dependent 2,4-dienoyl-CoA reductase/sulfur reductase-like enzyme